jgi:hypothetical protein
MAENYVPTSLPTEPADSGINLPLGPGEFESLAEALLSHLVANTSLIALRREVTAWSFSPSKHLLHEIQ